MPVDSSTGAPVSSTRSSSGVFDVLARGDLPERLADALEQVDRLDRERRRDEEHAALAAVLGQAAPLLLGELHALPVVVARRVLPAERHAERLGRRALGGGDVRLELHGVGAGVGDRVDERVRQAQAAVVGQRHLADDAGSARVPSAAHGRMRTVVRHALASCSELRRVPVDSLERTAGAGEHQSVHHAARSRQHPARRRRRGGRAAARLRRQRLDASRRTPASPASPSPRGRMKRSTNGRFGRIGCAAGAAPPSCCDVLGERARDVQQPAADRQQVVEVVRAFLVVVELAAAGS